MIGDLLTVTVGNSRQIQTILIASNKSADYKNVRDINGKMKIFRSTNEWKDGNGNQVKWEGSSLKPAECQHGIKKTIKKTSEVSHTTHLTDYYLFIWYFIILLFSPRKMLGATI